jgi:NAD(P)H-flavin reductase
MKDYRARVERISRLNAQYIQLDLSVEDDSLKQIKPGQSVLARIADKLDEVQPWHLYLREQWYPIGITGRDVLRVELPIQRTYELGEVVQLLGPVGLPFRFRKTLRNVLLVAYNTAPTPLTVMTPNLLKNNVAVTLVLLGEARNYNTDHLAPEIEVIKGDNAMNWENMVMTLGWADQMFIVVSKDDELFRMQEVLNIVREKRTDVAEQYVFGVFQPLLPCGVGACDACALRLKDGIKMVCTDGPAFDLTSVKFG